MSRDLEKDELFKQLYTTHYEPVRRYLRSCGVAEELLDDVTQDTFERLYDRIYSSSDRPIANEKLVAYLYTIARNLVIDLHRHKRIVDAIETDVDDTFLQGIADEVPLPEDVYEEAELDEERRKATEKLPKKIAEAVKGLLDGKTFEIIAHEIGIQVPALRYRLRKARELLNNM